MAMQKIEQLTDAEIEESDRSASLFDKMREMTAPLSAFLSLVHAFEWLNVRDATGRAALRRFFQGGFGDPVDIATGMIVVDSPVAHPRTLRLIA